MKDHVKTQGKDSYVYQAKETVLEQILPSQSLEGTNFYDTLISDF